MQRFNIFLIWLFVGWTVSAVELKFDFRDCKLNETPPGFRSTVSGKGSPGDWKVILDDAPTMFPPISATATSVSKRPVLAQLSRDPADDRQPLLILTNESFGDFQLTTRFKMVDGATEQMAGIAFRIQDEKNYYYIRASALGKNLGFYKWLNGQLFGPIGAKLDIQTNLWYELSIQCRGNEIRAALNRTNTLRIIHDSSFANGRVGFWTKSDSVSYFGETRITFTPKEMRAQWLVREALQKYTRLVGLKIYASPTNEPVPRLLAGTVATEIAEPSDPQLQQVLAKGTCYYLKERQVVAVTMPLHDCNGERVAIARVIMKSFPGQTEKNALERALPIIKFLESRFQRGSDLLD